MKISSTLRIGEHHVNYCEDYLLISEIGNNRSVLAVMDGCSMGTDSHLIATLTGKLLRKISLEYSYHTFITKTTDDLGFALESIVRRLFHELKNIKQIVQLNKEELLCTLLIAVIDAREHSAEILCIGDGLVCINGSLFEFEQGNKPDYMGYHLNEDFDDWYKGQQQRLSAVHITDLSIATDGIFTFRKFDQFEYAQQGDVIEYLLMDKQADTSANMLERKLLEIRDSRGLKPTDDLAIIRWVAD